MTFKEEMKFRGMTWDELLRFKLSGGQKYPKGYAACTFCGGRTMHSHSCMYMYFTKKKQ